jgi:protein O-mannosyl-transferase
MAGKQRRRAEKPATLALTPRQRRAEIAGTRWPPANAQSTALRWLIPLFLISVGVLVYHNALSGPFIFDDTTAILSNPSIRQLWPPWAPLSPPPGSSVSRRPVVNVSLAINYAFGGLDVRGYHMLNLSVHILCSLLLFSIARRTLASEVLGERFRRAGPWVALAIALIWMVHPLQTESVDYIVQRTELLMALFFLLTLYCVVRGADSARSWVWFSLAILCSALGMASKEVAGVLPVAVLLYDRVFLSRSVRETLEKRSALYIGLALTWLVLAAGVQERLPAGSDLTSRGLTPWDYVRTQLGAIVHYLRLTVWPSPLTVDYDDWPVARSIASVAPAAAVVLVLLGMTVWAFRHKPALAFLGAWFFLILAPTSSIVPIPTELLAERRMYLPLAAVIALGAAGGHVLLEQLGARLGWQDAVRRYMEVGVALALVVVLARVTIERNADYRSADAILGDAVAKRPNNSRAHNNLGSVFASQGRTTEAVQQFAEAVRLKPDYVDARYNLADGLARAGQFNEAMAQYSDVLRLNPAHPEAHNKLAILLREHGRIEDAIMHHREALRLNPLYAEAHNDLGIALASEERLSEAISHYSEALRLRPDYAEAHNNWGIALARQGRLDEATSHFLQALRLRPAYAEAQNNLGTALMGQGRLEEAIAHYNQALRLNPSFARVHYNIGLAQTRLGKTEQAAQHFEAAAKIDPALRPPQPRP